MTGKADNALLSCGEVQQVLLEGEPAAAPSAGVSAHLEGCPACRVFRAQLVSLDEAVLAQAPELPASFELTLRRELTRAERGDPKESRPPRRSSKPWLVRALALAAVMLLAAGAVLFLARRDTGMVKPVSYHQLRLSIVSPRSIPKARFEIMLPKGVAPLPSTQKAIGRDRLAWWSPLGKGINEIDLPLQARSARGMVRIRVSVGEQHWSGQVALRGAEKGKAKSATSPTGQRFALLLEPRLRGRL